VKQGRNFTLIIIDLISLIGLITYLISGAQKVDEIFLFGRSVCGVCVGGNLVVNLIYVKEMSPEPMEDGFKTLGWQTCIFS